MKKLIYSLSVVAFCVLIAFSCFFVKANDRAVTYDVPIGAYEWDFDVDNIDYVFTNLNFSTFSYPNTPYYNFHYLNDSYTEGGNSYTIKSFRYFGHNWWNQEVANGFYNTSTGELVYNNSYRASQSLIRVNPDTKYFINSEYTLIWLFYDENKNKIMYGQQSYLALGNNEDFTTPSNCYYISFWKSGTDDISNTCLNLYNEDINGIFYTYYEYSNYSANYSFNDRCIRLHDVYSPLTDDYAVLLKDILVTNNHLKSVSGWYTFSTGSYLENYNNQSYFWFPLNAIICNPVNNHSYVFDSFNRVVVSYDVVDDYIDEMYYSTSDNSMQLGVYMQRSANTSPRDCWIFAQGSKILLDSQYIAEEAYGYLVLNGVFSYIGDFNNSNPQFADVVNTIISVPINYLRQLFNIELLGTSLFIILCSIMTIALVIYVIKKI